MKRFRLAALALVLTLAGVAAVPGTTDLHFALSRSMPEADTKVQAPETITLWFTQVPQDETMTIRLVDSDGELVETGDLMQHEDDGKVFSLPMETELGEGAYTVAWRGIGPDGHVVRGDFGFAVTVEE